MLYVKVDNEIILPYGEEVQRRHTPFIPLDLSTVVSRIGTDHPLTTATVTLSRPPLLRAS